jgi:hypothetical protein
MKRAILVFQAILFGFSLMIMNQGCAPKTIKIKFDGAKEVSGAKFALKDIAPGLPTNWDEYNFVVFELKSSTPQRFHIGFTSETGYHELRVMSYAANGWIRLCIPLKYYRDLPGASGDRASTFNKPRFTGWFNPLGLIGKGSVGPLRGVDSIGFRMIYAINDPVIELRSVTLAVEDPGDLYMEDKPLVDEFGQWNLGDFDGKIKSLAQLKEEWKAEDEEVVSTEAYRYSQYGGYLDARVKGTGFFRTEKIDNRWWFVDPEGYLFLSLGADCINPGGGGNAKDIDKRRNFYKILPPDTIGSYIARPNSASFGIWNLFRRYGNEYPEKSNAMIIKRMDKWGLNTIANWSSKNVINLNKKAFMLQMGSFGGEPLLLGLPDVYSTNFQKRIDEAVKKYVEPFRDNPRLIGYFLGNEPAWQGQESRLCDLILAVKEDKPIKTVLTDYLKVGDTPERRKEFILNTFRKYLEIIKSSIKHYDPNHLNLGMRFVPGNDILKICKGMFDVFSFNCYDIYPKKELMDRILSETDLPMIIGEYHFGTVDRGMSQSQCQVTSQEQRGVAYRYYTERAFAHPGLIGTAYFQWSDQDLTGRSDGEGFNCGLVDVTDRPYKFQTEAMMETAKILRQIHLGEKIPFDQAPVRAYDYGLPDKWN